MKAPNQSSIFAVFVCASLLQPGLAPAEVVGWHPSLTWQVGQGINYYHQREAKPPVAVVGSSPSNSPPSGSVDFTAHFAQSHVSIANTLHVNQQVGFEFESFANGKSGIDFIDQLQISASDLTFVIRFTRDFGYQLFPVQALDPSAFNVLQSLHQQQGVIKSG